MSAARSLFEMGRRAYAHRLEELNDRMEDLMDVDSSDSDAGDEMEELIEEAELIGFAMGWMEPQDTRMGHRIISLDEFGDQECYELFKFKKDELQTMHDMLRIPDIVRVNGSKYTKLEVVLCVLGRYSSAAQLSRMTPTFKLHAKRLSELKLHTCKVIYEAKYTKITAVAACVQLRIVIVARLPAVRWKCALTAGCRFVDRGSPVLMATQTLTVIGNKLASRGTSVVSFFLQSCLVLALLLGLSALASCKGICIIPELQRIVKSLGECIALLVSCPASMQVRIAIHSTSCELPPSAFW